MEERLKELIKNTNYIYDLEDTLEWIMYYKEELLKILQEDSNQQ